MSMPIFAAAAAASRHWLEGRPPATTNMSLFRASASPIQNSRLRTLLPPKASGMQSSRLIQSCGCPVTRPMRRIGSSAVGPPTRSIRGNALSMTWSRSRMQGRRRDAEHGETSEAPYSNRQARRRCNPALDADVQDVRACRRAAFASAYCSNRSRSSRAMSKVSPICARASSISAAMKGGAEPVGSLFSSVRAARWG